MKSWYLIQTKSRQEFIAEENLVRQGYSVYLPRNTVNRKIQGQWQDCLQPFFPGYLFIQLDFENENSSTIRSTHGVLKLVRFGAEPEPVPENLVTELQERISVFERDTKDRLPIKKGDRITITDGSFRGLDAIFLTQTGNQRVELLLDMLGRQHKMILEKNNIKPLDK